MIVKYQDINDIIDEKNGYTQKYIEEHACEIVEVINTVSRELKKLCPSIVIRYNENLITQVLIDAIEDLKRIHEFHPINNANAIKEAAYIGYWWQRRKPVIIEGDITTLCVEGKSEDQVKKIKAWLLFINEVCISYYVRPKIFHLRQPIQQCITPEKQADWGKAREHFIYYLAYRAGSPRSIEAVLSGETLHPIWPTKQEFWNIL